MAYIGNTLDTIVKQGKKAYVYTATSGQTVFTGSDDNGESLDITVDGFVNVFLNGIRLIKTDDYTVSTDTITLTSGASLGDELVIVADIESAIYNTYTQSETNALVSPKLDSTAAASTYAPLSAPVFTGGYIKLPSGTTASPPSPSSPGMLRYNSDKGVLEQYVSDNVWASIAPSAAISSVELPGSQTAVYTGDTVTVNGIGFDSGATVSYVDASNNETQAPTTSRVDSTQLTATIPSLSEGSYTLVVTNGTGVSASLSNAFDVDGVAVFNSASGSLGSFDDYTAVSVDAGATEDGATLNVTITTGSLPTGLSMNSTGAITGTLNTDITLDTTYSFTVSATDAENQTTTRNFSITVNAVYVQTQSAFFG